MRQIDGSMIEYAAEGQQMEKFRRGSLNKHSPSSSMHVKQVDIKSARCALSVREGTSVHANKGLKDASPVVRWGIVSSNRDLSSSRNSLEDPSNNEGCLHYSSGESYLLA